MFRRRGRRGSSLVEMVVAVALLGVGISACVACIGSATRASGVAEDTTAVQLLAREKLAELELQGAGEGQDQGDFGEERPGFAWRTMAEPAETPGLTRVRLTILSGDPERPRQTEFVTYVRGRSRPSATRAASGACQNCHGKISIALSAAPAAGMKWAPLGREVRMASAGEYPR